jgi:lipopolysaccharide export system protein LptA
MLALGLAILYASAAHGQALVRESLARPGDSTPIQLFADDVATWTDAGKQVFLVKGRVWIEQGSINLRVAQAVVWVDQSSRKDSGPYLVEVYGENLGIEDGKTSRTAATALLQLATIGEVRIKSYGTKAVSQQMPNDPLYARARRALDPAASAVSASSPVTSPASASTASGSTAPMIQLAQAVSPPVAATPVQPQNVAPPPTTPAQAAPPIPGPVTPGLSPLANSAEGGPKQLSIRPRSGTDFDLKFVPRPNGETAVVINNGAIVTVTDPVTRKVLLDIEADRLCMWTRENSKEIFGKSRAPQGETAKPIEFYLSGHVEIRNQAKVETETIRADEVYYDVNRNVAIALRADLEVRKPDLPYPIHFKAEELQQLNVKLFLAKQAEVYSTVLPSDPGLRIIVREAKIEEYDYVKKSLFGTPVIDSKTGQPLVEKRHTFTGEDNLVRFEGVPIFYAPYLQTDVERPLGPLDSASFSYNKIFGFQISTTWDLYELLGIQRPEGNRWKLFADGMTARGPALGTEFDTAGKDLFGITNRYEGMLKLYGIYDQGPDILGGNRGREVLLTPFPVPIFEQIEHPLFRGRIFGNLNVQDLPNGFTVQGQVAGLSDRNFLEQYFVNEFQNGPNQETFAYVKQQNNIWAWSILADANFQRWMTATDWGPRADGYVLGLKIFDLFTYNVHGSAGYAQLRPNTTDPPAYQITEQRDNTGRFDLWQDISLPFTLGAFKIVPYANVDLTEYTQDLTGEQRGRFYGGGGVRASIPFSRLYPEVQSDLFNVNGIFHKIVLSGNYYVAHSDTPFTQLPQLDQLNDNTSDQALRDIRPWQPLINPTNALFLTTSPVFNPQVYALRRLIFSNVDTLDSIQVFQMDLRQRWQTKRGFPGNEHVIDWMTLDVRASIYPDAQRDNFGASHWGDIEYDWVWNIGDRTALVSNGWFEPIDHGPRVFNIGAYIGRPDRTTFYLGYRQIDPLQSRAVITSLTYAFSAKYAITFSSNFDFGNDIQTNSLMISRIGTDVTVSLGLSYNSIVRTFGVQFEVVPNLLPINSRNPAASAFGPTGTLASR